jgi:hypothetical protein
VFYRTANPDNTTVQEVRGILTEKNIDFSKMVDNPTNHCQEVENVANTTYLVRQALSVQQLNVQACVGINI